MKNKRILLILAVVAAILSVPLVAMQFTQEVDWSASDFALMGSLLFVAGLLIDWVLRKVRTASYRIALSITVVAAFLLVWAELAVGIFGTPFAGN